MQAGCSADASHGGTRRDNHLMARVRSPAAGGGLYAPEAARNCAKCVGTAEGAVPVGPRPRAWLLRRGRDRRWHWAREWFWRQPCWTFKQHSGRIGGARNLAKGAARSREEKRVRTKRGSRSYSGSSSVPSPVAGGFGSSLCSAVLKTIVRKPARSGFSSNFGRLPSSEARSSCRC